MLKLEFPPSYLLHHLLKLFPLIALSVSLKVADPLFFLLYLSQVLFLELLDELIMTALLLADQAYRVSVINDSRGEVAATTGLCLY